MPGKERENNGGERPQTYYVPFDEYGYRKVVDWIDEYVRTYMEQTYNDDGRTSDKMANLFEAILDFCHDCPRLPDHLRDPPLKEWEISSGLLHPRYVMRYCMKVYNELLRQTYERRRAPDALLKKYGLKPEER